MDHRWPTHFRNSENGGGRGSRHPQFSVQTSWRRVAGGRTNCLHRLYALSLWGATPVVALPILRKASGRSLWTQGLLRLPSLRRASLFIPRGYTPPLPDKQGWWRKGMSNARWARSPVGYIAKYASKGTSGELPRGARLHGHIGLTEIMLALRSWSVAPVWLRQFCERGNRLMKNGSWWRDCVTRIEYRTPWVMDGFRDGGIELRWVGWTVEDVRFV